MLCQTIGDQVAALPEELPDLIAHDCTRALIDWVAAVLAGGEDRAAVAIRMATEAIAGPGSAAIIGSTRLVDARTAALVNATAAHAAEVDDVYRDGIYHPGAPTIAAALAVGQSNGVDGSALLRSIAIGYEVSCRIAAAVQPAHYRYWHTTGTIGTLGAAVAAASILGLDAGGIANALALATTFAAGLQQSFRSEAMAKPMHAGHAADAGVIAALGAANGLTGALDVLEGAAGFGAAMSEAVDWKRVVAPWDLPWAVMEITVKNHTACGHTFAPIDAMLALRNKFDLKAGDIAHVLVETAAIPIEVAGNPNPRTPFEAKFSIPYCIAAAMEFGSVRLAAFSQAALNDPVLRELADRTELKVGAAFNSVFPNQRAARVTIKLNNGESIREEAWTRRGDPDDPLSDEELSAKFIELAKPTLEADAPRILESLWHLRQAPTVAGVLRHR